MNELNKIGNIHSIEHFGTVDGPGVRYVLFLQGCPFKCKYCHNRDTWSTGINKQLTVSDIISDYKKYQAFYKEGGVTVSGGEPTLQIDFLISLFKEFKRNNVHTTLDTSAGCYSKEQNNKYLELLKYTDLVLLDIKQIDNKKHIDLTGNPNNNVLAFADLLNEIKKPVVIRYVLVKGYTDDENDLVRLRDYLKRLSNIIKVDILPYHDKGKEKWFKMNLTYPLEGVKVTSEEDVKKAKEILKID